MHNVCRTGGGETLSHGARRPICPLRLRWPSLWLIARDAQASLAITLVSSPHLCMLYSKPVHKARPTSARVHPITGPLAIACRRCASSAVRRAAIFAPIAPSELPPGVPKPLPPWRACCMCRRPASSSACRGSRSLVVRLTPREHMRQCTRGSYAIAPERGRPHFHNSGNFYMRAPFGVCIELCCLVLCCTIHYRTIPCCAM